MSEENLDLTSSERIEIPLNEKGLSDSVAASVAAAQSALEDSMQKASALQMTAMQTAITEFKAAAELMQGLISQVSELLTQADDLKAEALELVEALTPQQNESQEGHSEQQENTFQNSTIGKATHMKILKKILSK